MGFVFSSDPFAIKMERDHFSESSGKPGRIVMNKRSRSTALQADTEVSAPGEKFVAPLGEDGAPLGLRERNKLEKAFAIRQAARELFLAHGYEATTLREVAKRADVGFGTVFSYAVDKPGLLAMVFVEDLQHLPPLFNEASDAPLVEQAADAFTQLYAFWARTPVLSREVLPQMEFYRANPFAEAIMSRRNALKAELARWLAHCVEQGRVAGAIDPVVAADTIFAIFTSALREWIVSDPLDLDAGRNQLRRLLHLPFAAIEAGR